MKTEAQSKFKLLSATEKLIDYQNYCIPNYPKKEIVLRQNIERNQYELIENIFSYNINTSIRIKDKYMKDFLVKLSMCDFYMNISYHKKFISKHKLECIARMLIEIRKIAYGLIRGNNDAV